MSTQSDLFPGAPPVRLAWTPARDAEGWDAAAGKLRCEVWKSEPGRWAWRVTGSGKRLNGTTATAVAAKAYCVAMVKGLQGRAM